ncbi:hypothetical protein I7X30_08220 [Capnocytophaga sp. 051621]|jgi:hypothetical protein|uniref:Uncharacterized protein n=4 Tax=Flavobacteriaceae TaxID=49546 RepID=A0A1Z4BMK6_9FLAO|nr:MULTISPECIES: hypothetical protein [Capnocytophaga]ASF42541.1 hypothetical protein CBG49_05310 [Capnocytophaga endodontalis]MBI1647040.1 hypothetical protein [Capnocytophaga periodontitidis]MBM0650372.1 hypothetical protein [Capnocytophaga genosp. AHN8471]MBM0662232.1 hypothetical protein [Capnocytophaga genosp. AHN8471]
MKKPNIFLAILTGIGFIVLSIICGLGSSLSLRIIDVLLLFTPIIFVLGLLCYYSFYYKSVKKIFWVSVCLTVLTMLYTYHKDEIEESYTVWQSQQFLPKNLKNYPELSSKELTQGKKTITPLYERGGYSLKKKFFNDQYQLVTLYNKSNTSFYFFKFDTSGKIIDSLPLNTAEKQKREFHIKDKYIIDTYTLSYSTWAIDGNPEFRPMKAIEGTDFWKENDVRTYISKNHLPTPTCYKIGVRNIEWRPDNQKYYTTFNYESIVVFIQDGMPHYICSTNYIYSFQNTLFDRTSIFPLFMKLGADDFYYSDFQSTYTRRKILPQYFLIEETLDKGGEGKLFMQLRLNNASISFKVDTYTLTSEGVALKTPTYYLTKGNEELEKFEKVDLYSNKLLQYQLLSIKGRLYMVK